MWKHLKLYMQYDVKDVQVDMLHHFLAAVGGVSFSHIPTLQSLGLVSRERRMKDQLSANSNGHTDQSF